MNKQESPLKCFFILNLVCLSLDLILTQIFISVQFFYAQENHYPFDYTNGIHYSKVQIAIITFAKIFKLISYLSIWFVSFRSVQIYFKAKVHKRIMQNRKLTHTDRFVVAYIVIGVIMNMTNRFIELILFLGVHYMRYYNHQNMNIE